MWDAGCAGDPGVPDPDHDTQLPAQPRAHQPATPAAPTLSNPAQIPATPAPNPSHNQQQTKTQMLNTIIAYCFKLFLFRYRVK